MPHLGLVVVDEEQDPSYKQQDPAPRYNARDTAIVLAGLHDARVILASATPSLESWSNGGNGRSDLAGTLSPGQSSRSVMDGNIKPHSKYGLVELSERWGGTLPPEVLISDTIRAAKRGERRSHFNKELSDRIKEALGRGEQVILFQNRRGIAPFVECTDCGHVTKCAHCAIPMTVHRGELRCHYCGAVVAMPSLCPGCGSMNLSVRGFGTEKIEEELVRLFPEARVARLDRDSATSERAYRRIIDDFEAGETDILVGTQMVTKGLDFAGVSLVGVLNADNLVNHPDFRASERAYSLIAQVAGRAGRRGRNGGNELAGTTHPDSSFRSVSNGVAHVDGITGRGQVVIQTASPESRLIAQAAAGDYRAMAADLLAERAMYGYPPYSRLISVMLRHADRQTLNAAAVKFAELLRPSFGDRLLGPQPPVTEKIKGEFALLFLLKVERGKPLSAARETLQTIVHTLLSDRALRKTTLTVNVDPQ
jgi:primosomal protein N' (replication factor Y)